MNWIGLPIANAPSSIAKWLHQISTQLTPITLSTQDSCIGLSAAPCWPGLLALGYPLQDTGVSLYFCNGLPITIVLSWDSPTKYTFPCKTDACYATTFLIATWDCALHTFLLSLVPLARWTRASSLCIRLSVTLSSSLLIVFLIGVNQRVRLCLHGWLIPIIVACLQEWLHWKSAQRLLL